MLIAQSSYALPIAASTTPAVVGVLVGSTGLLSVGLTGFLADRSQRRQQAADRRQHERDVETQRYERLRSQMIESTVAFATALEWIRSRVILIPVDEVDALIPTLDEHLAHAQTELGPISLLFGPDSDTADKARTACYRAMTTIAAVRSLAELEPKAREHHELGTRVSNEGKEFEDSVNAFATVVATALGYGHTASRAD